MIYPAFRTIEARKGRLPEYFNAWGVGQICFAELDAGIRDWLNHLYYADAWDRREPIFRPFVG